EIPVAGGGDLEVGHLALHPDVVQLDFQEALDAVGELADGKSRAPGRPRRPRSRSEIEPLLLHTAILASHRRRLAAAGQVFPFPSAGPDSPPPLPVWFVTTHKNTRIDI